MAQLAIRGHATRGKEVIEILEMLGGVNRYHRKGNVMSLYYYIGSTTHIYSANEISPTEYFVFTLEEFLEKFPYKVGDKVLLNGVVKTIKQACWDNTENEVIYKLETNVRGFSEEYYVHHYDLQPYKEETMEEIKVDIPKGYEFAGVDDDKQQVVFTKIQPQYPKTYEECCEILNICPNGNIVYAGNWVYGGDYLDKHLERIRNFQKLLICRDAYWKLAGEQMGLGKPWEPDWRNSNEDKYCIEYSYGRINSVTTNIYNYILAFPTAEMRDAFYENFKVLIEQCKELL